MLLVEAVESSWSRRPSSSQSLEIIDRRLFLNAVRCKSSLIFNLFSSKYQSVTIKFNPFNFRKNVFHLNECVLRVNINCDCCAFQSFHMQWLSSKVWWQVLKNWSVDFSFFQNQFLNFSNREISEVGDFFFVFSNSTLDNQLSIKRVELVNFLGIVSQLVVDPFFELILILDLRKVRKPVSLLFLVSRRELDLEVVRKIF